MADSPRRAISPDDALPPVEPPSAGFLVQLFLVPALIVGIIVCVWLAFHWLAQLGNDPQAAVRALRRNTEGRWQAALNLANDLRGPGGGKLKADEALAGELASVLADEVKSGRPVGGGHSAEQSRTLCVYLCRALGEFAVPAAAPPLITRAEATDQPEIARAAVEALAVLATNLAAAGEKFADSAAVTATVIAAMAGIHDADPVAAIKWPRPRRACPRRRRAGRCGCRGIRGTRGTRAARRWIRRTRRCGPRGCP